MESIFDDIRILDISNLPEIYQLEIETYPKELQDSVTEMKNTLNSNNLHFGAYYQGKLIGFLLSLKENPQNQEIYIYDLTIDQNFQKQGLGKHLTQLFLKEALQHNYEILIACRSTSYPLFSNKELLASVGYKITENKLEKDGYFPNYGIHEDLYRIRLQPF